MLMCKNACFRQDWRITVRASACIAILLALQEGIAKAQDFKPEDLIDAEKVIVALQNHNTPPVIVNDGAEYQPPLFNEKYDWAEQERIVRRIRFLKCHAEEAWPILLKHFDDKRYCVTVANEGHERAQNYSVGDVCQAIVRNYLTAAYDRYLPPTQLAFLRFHYPFELRKAEDLKAWCEKRRNMRLYELQIDMCRWAIRESAHGGPLTDQERSEFVDALRVEIAALRRSRTAIGYRWLGEGVAEVVSYNAEIARKIREDWNPSKEEGKK